MAVIGNSATQQAFTPAVDYFSGNGSTTAFTLSRPVASVAQVEAVIDNVVQNPSSAYTVSSNTITFTSAPLSGTNNIYVRYTSPITQVIAPGQGTVTATSMVSSTGTGAAVFATSPTITTPTLSGDTTASTINGVTVGKGGGSVSTNTAVGASALNATNTGGLSTCVGYNAGSALTSGDSNNFFGAYAGRVTTTGLGNVGIGTSVLYDNISGNYNIAVGQQALRYNTASNNTAVGYQAGYSNSTNQYGTFIGSQAGYNSTGDFNTFVGYYAGRSTTGEQNTFIGKYAGNAVTTGTLNTIIGAYNGNQGGLDIRTASNYIVLSDGGGNPRGYFDNNGMFQIGGNPSFGGEKLGVVSSGTYVASMSQGTNSSGYNVLALGLLSNGNNTSSSFIRGNTSAVGNWYLYGNGTSSFSSDQRLKKNIETTRDGYLEDLAKLRVVKYNWKNDADGTPKELGLIAQEVEQVFAGLVQDDANTVSEEDPTIYKQLKGSVLPFMLLKAIQELKALVDAQATEIAELKAKVGV